MKPASGALNAAASPAPAPADRSCGTTDDGTPSTRDVSCAAAAPICTVGPSRPSERPAPMPSTPPTNFTGISRSARSGRTPSRTAFKCGMPLPPASGAIRVISPTAQPTTMPIAGSTAQPHVGAVA